MPRPPTVLALLLLGAAHCGGVVVTPDNARPDASPTDASPADAPPADAPPDRPDSPPCADVRAACGPLPQQVVVGRATGLVGLDGARARFAIRYARAQGEGPGSQLGVVSAWATVRGGSFEACVCLPRGGSEYPALAALVLAPGAAGETGADLARASYSQRFATLGEEDFTMALAEPAPRPIAEAALAAMEERALAVTVRGLDAAPAGAAVHAGVVAAERPVASQLATARVEGGRAALSWSMPGRARNGERAAVLVDRNNDRRCDPGDLGGFAALGGGAEASVGALVTGDALAPVCAALALETPRER